MDSIKIFAKLGTSSKVAFIVKQSNVRNFQFFLSFTYGGQWLLVDELKENEVLTFDDNLVYEGFYLEQKRYCNGIDTFE